MPTFQGKQATIEFLGPNGEKLFVFGAREETPALQAGGVDIRKTAEAFWALLHERFPSFRKEGCPRTPPPVAARWVYPKRFYVHGYAAGAYRPRFDDIRLRFGQDVRRELVLTTTLHELCHAFVGQTGPKTKKSDGWHGRQFYLVMCGAAEILWGVRVDIDLRRKYATDRALEDALIRRGL